MPEVVGHIGWQVAIVAGLWVVFVVGVIVGFLQDAHII